ncbi:MAG: aminotransferase class V-fold PLP-dependent enzyme [Ruminococcaceae bacterium]|nr:aminotransferase class V-fold PLP-dependent enzyme [Oscillospiraceae bacterium]
MIYLDNAATTFPKPETVIKKTEEFIRKYCANSGRSSHSLAIKTDEEIYRARESVAELLSFPNPERVCFTTNATYALNIAIKSFITKKCHVLISDIEHNSILRPIYKLKEKIGIEYSVFSTDGDIEKNIQNALHEDTYAIITTLTSNVTGKEIPIQILSNAAKRYNLKLIVDASQLIGHKEIDVMKTHCDAICAPGHKGLFGIQGAGFAVFVTEPPYETIIEGGSGNESQNPNMPRRLPERFEAGTLPAPSIVALGSGIDYLKEIGISKVENRIRYLTEEFYEELQKNKRLKIYAAENGIISFAIPDINSHKVASFLDKRDICVRSGLHCAPMAHSKLGTLKNGLVRVSLSIFNTTDDALYISRVLGEI